MDAIKRFFASRWGIVSVGIFIGLFAALLQKWGNPGNMGICVACFKRDIAGAVGLHRAEVVQYLRPEIIGFVLVALPAAYTFKEFHPRAGSTPIGRNYSTCQPFQMVGHAAPEMIARAYEHANAARNLLVKGSKDYVPDREGIWPIVDHPGEEALEAIGGTGDTLTGIVAALMASGMPLQAAAEKAAKINRLAGARAQPTPATQVIDIIQHISSPLG